MKKILFLLSLLITPQITLFAMQQANQIVFATPNILQIEGIISHGTSQQIENLPFEHLNLEQLNNLKNFSYDEGRRINLQNQKMIRDLYIDPSQIIGVGVIGLLARKIPAYANAICSLHENELALLAVDKFLNYFLGYGFIAAGIGLALNRLHLKEEIENNNKMLSNIQSLNEEIFLMRFKRAPVKSD